MSKLLDKPILVHIHLYYTAMWPELKLCLDNISSQKFELFITMVENNSEITRTIKKDFPLAHIKIIENKGFDIGPFINIINHINLKNYSYIIKLHTKRNIEADYLLNGYDMSHEKWRKYALNFVSDDTNFNKCLDAFEKNPRLGMIGDYHLILNSKNDRKAEIRKTEQFLKPHFSEIKYGFVAGSMFMCRAELLKKLQDMNISDSDFKQSQRNQGIQLPYVLERALGCIILSQDYQIHDVCNSLLQKIVFLSYKLVSAFGRFIYRRKVKANGDSIVKICKIQIHLKGNKK